MSKITPGIPVVAVIFTYCAPLSFAEVWPPFFPGCFAGSGFIEAKLFGIGVFRHRYSPLKRDRQARTTTGYQNANRSVDELFFRAVLRVTAVTRKVGCRPPAAATSFAIPPEGFSAWR